MSYQASRIKIINNKNDYEITINNIRKLLNKLSYNNFEKLIVKYCVIIIHYF